MIFNLVFLFLYTFISELNCLYKNEIKELNLNMKQKLGILDSNNYIYNCNFNDIIINKNFSVGKFHEETLNYSNKYIYNFNGLGKNNNLYFHFYPLGDCQIKISSNNPSVEIVAKSNYNNNLFYSQINSGNKLKSISYKIEPINYLNKDSNSLCYISINSVKVTNKNNNIPILNLKEKMPTFLHFNKNLKKIRLYYNLPKEKNESIVFSFFIKDKVKFNVTFEPASLNKTISYIDKFIIKKDLIAKSTNKNISILLTLKEEDKESDVIVRVIGDNSRLYYLERNFLNLEFILSEEKIHYYYMEVYKDEEGEIILHDKRKIGTLASKIYNSKEFPKVYDFKNISNNSDEEFDIYSQKLTFNTTDCKNLNYKCYLLITYSGPHNLSNVIGTEFTLLTRIWDKFEFISHIVNIPLNEYIFGKFDEKSPNYHYYTVFIPEESENINIEIHGYKINAYIINGIKKINKKNNGIYDIDYNYNSNKIKKISITKAYFNLNTFKNQYISFSIFRRDMRSNKTAIYYFRVLQPDPINNIIIYPLDSNVENLCIPNLVFNINSCLFLLKNDYNDLSHSLIIKELYDKVEKYSKIIISKTNEDYYSTNLTNKIFDNFSEHLNIDNITIDYYVIIKVETKNKYKNKDNFFFTILSNFYETNTSIQIYSYKLIYLLERKEIDFNLDINKNKQFKLRIMNNMPQRKLEIRFFKENDIKANFDNNYGKQFSCLIDEFDKLKLSCQNNLAIYARFDFKRERQNLEEINYHNSFIPIIKKKDFPIIFYLKDTYNNGLDFNIYYKNKIENLNIIGYVIDFHDIEKLDKNRNKEYVDYYHMNKGIYDNVTQTGVIEFNNFTDPKIDSKDIYYIIEIFGDSTNIIPDSNIYIYSNPKENFRYKIPLGKYIRGIFNSTQDKNQTYYIEPNNNKSNTITIIELSSNYKNIEISINKSNKCNLKKESKGYVQIYKIEGKINEFTIKLEHNDNITINNSLIVNYIFKYYYSTAINETNYIPNVECYFEPKNANESKTDINITCKNSTENNNTLNYSYYLRLYQNSNRIDDEELNTLAITSSKFCYYNEYHTNSSEFNFTVSGISVNEVYLGYLFIKNTHSENNWEIFKVTNLIINVSLSKQNEFGNLSKRYIIIIIIGIIIIIIIILTITLIKTKKKNKELEEQVSKISFGAGDNDSESSDDEFNRKVSYV